MTRCALAVIAALTISLAPKPLVAAACPDSTQMDLNRCAAADLKTSDAALNRAYGKLMGQIGPRAKQSLRDAEAAWLTFRDRSCALESLGAEGGSAQPLVDLMCRKRLTDERTKALTAYLTCEEGDLACVGRLSQ